jgi:F-type H+-transporting ATPase subunit gamma
MSDSVDLLRKKIGKVRTLGSVVRTMKTLASLNIRQYEESVRSLADYNHTIELALAGSMKSGHRSYFGPETPGKKQSVMAAIVFGSDQGLVGQFNDHLAGLVKDRFDGSAESRHIMVVGEQIRLRLALSGMVAESSFGVPGSVNAITWLVGDLLMAIEQLSEKASLRELRMFYNTPSGGGLYQSVSMRLLPLDDSWERDTLGRNLWPTKTIPDLPGGQDMTRWALVREYLFVSIFRVCAESLAAENASRLAAMQRAGKNIDEMLEELSRHYRERRQARIDEELFDVVSGFSALTGKSWKERSSGDLLRDASKSPV